MVSFFLPNGLPDAGLHRLPAAQMPYVWRVSPSETCCPDCLALDGEVRSLDEWLNTVTPGSPNLACSGRACTCRLEATIEPVSGRVLQTRIRSGAFGQLFFVGKALRHIDLDPPGRVQPDPAPPSYNVPASLPDRQPRSGRRALRWR